MRTHAPVVLEQALNEQRCDADQRDRLAASRCPTVGDILREALPLALFVPVAGPPAILLVGPLLLLVLLLIPPAAVLITLAVVGLAGAAVLFALGVFIASPYLLVRHLQRRQPGHRWRLASLRRQARSAPAVSEAAGVRVGRPVQQPGGSSVIHLTTR
jgi:hypothetical protein